MSESDLKEREDSAALDGIESQFSPEEKAQFDQLADNDPKPEVAPDDQVGKGYTAGNGSKKSFWTSRKKKGGIIGIVGVTAGFGIFSIIGPGLTINTLREMLIGKLSSLQIDHQRRYRRSKFAKVTDVLTKDGRRGGKIIAEMERSGYIFQFDPNNRNRIMGLTLPGQNSSISNFSNGALAEHIEGYIEVRHPLRSSRWKTKRMEAFYGRYKVSRKSVTTRTGTNIDDPDAEINKRMLADVDGDAIETRITGTDAGDSDEDAEAKKQREAEYEQIAKGDGAVDEIKQKLKNGMSIDDLTDEERAIIKIASMVDDDVLGAIQNIANNQALGGKVLNSVKSFGSSTDILDKVCIAKGRLRAISLAARHHRALSLIRYVSVFIKAGDDVRQGKADPKLLNSLMRRVTAVDANGNAIGASPGFAYIMKSKFSKSHNEAATSSISVSGKLTGIPGAMQNATNGLPFTNKEQCGVIQNPVFQIGVAAVEAIGAFFTGGTTATISTGAKEAVKAAVKQGLKKIFSKQTRNALLKTAAFELTFEGALTLLQLYADKTQNLNFTGQESGGELGDILAAGGGTLNKQRGLSGGMVPATSQQYATAMNQYIAEQKEEQKNQSFFARVLDYNNYESLTFKVASIIATTPLSLGGASTLAQSTVATIGNPFTSIFNSFSSKAYAQENDEIAFEEYEVKGNVLATDPAGNLLPILRSDIENIDPEENIEHLKSTGDIDPESHEPISDNFKGHIKNCVDEVDTISTLENEDMSDPKFDCLATQAITVRYKAHLAWLDMLDGIDAYLFPEEIETALAPTPSTGGENNDTPAVGNTADTPCAPGTTDLGEPTGGGWSNGQKYNIRLCAIPGFSSGGTEDAATGGLVRVNSTVSGKWLQLFTGAQSAGTTLRATSSFRSNEKQTELYNCYLTKSCNGGNRAARPGFSNHQIGYAVDIAGISTTLATCQNNPDSYPIYKLLAAKGPPLGINARVEDECWHWAVGGN